MSDSLLPPSAGEFMRCIERAETGIEQIPVPLNTLWDPDHCPAPLLPYLAWARSVNRWDKNWPEQTKRAVIRASWKIHRHKGTIYALRQAVEPFGYLLKVNEWWQTGGPRGTFSLEIGIQEQGITDETRRELERLIDDAKPRSRHLTGIALSLQSTGTITIGAGHFYGDTLTVYPYLPEVITAGGNSNTGAIVHLIDTMELYHGE
ncbi:Bacteriophage P2-related tail formation protein [Edwardsiella tarda]|uniref:Phage tail protein I n=1 Tax=Edwardsiella tarda ATCC 15947 = NBRC 105688 TaxID=667121 RepID=A0AC61TI10_EDWTA|nr:phage tail protein I [Edwardsiella tarda]UAL56641.1 phage tail protein I [Edwardsiella tarda]UCQ00306.1 phage tail protein I [Edwardsiella tarda ATCC 15947 = NBRC 105688]STD27899.1 Bacteriophage P2-related tail formation protein [Edwardsiella tarda]STE53213.1 Bacteriophage P2-related tail formation protein [Edwardsiella tarda]